MSDEADGSRQHRRLIAERLRSAVLPHYRGQRVFGGRGDGAPCACCDERIAPADVQYDVDQRETSEDGALERVRSIPMHLHCYRLWVEESERPSAP
jgi:hypothetical protein